MALAQPTAPGARRTLAKTTATAGRAAKAAGDRERRVDDSGPESRRARELDDLRREDVAAQLALLGVPLKWQEHPLAELTDWRDRIEAAVTLRVQHRVEVDWRVTSLRDLTDMRLRAAKAAELSSVYGVDVDWRRYTWLALEGIRRNIAAMRSGKTESRFDPDGLASPAFQRMDKRTTARSNDPDAILEPTFAFDSPLLWSRPFGRDGRSDPDAILVPSFVTTPSRR